jgi:membrane protein YqaA with SNARE-associated domain
MMLTHITELAPRVARAAHKHPTAMHWLVGLGSVGLFPVAAVDASVIPLPLPGSTDLLLLVLASHTPDKWFLFAIVAIAGAMVGAYFSYDLAAKGGTELLDRYVPAKYTGRVTNWVKENPVLSIGLPALLPPPIPLTPFVIAAGALHMPKKKFLVTFAIFRAARYLIEASLAKVYGKHLIGLWRRYFGESMAPVIWIFVVLIAGGVGLLLWRKWREKHPVQKTPKPIAV